MNIINSQTDFFSARDNFKPVEHINSICIYKAVNHVDAFITVVIPTYKRSGTLMNSIDSVLGQVGYDDYNILVIDNNPERDDETDKMMKKYQGGRVSYYKNAENLGMSGNWNRGIVLAKSDWICMLHDDDTIDNDFFCEMIPIIKEKKGICVLQSYKYRKAKEKHYRYDGKLVRYKDLDFYYGHVTDVPSGIIYRKESIINEGGFNTDYYPSQDCCMHIRLAKNYPFYVLYKPLTHIIEDENNASGRVDVQRQWLVIDFYLLKQVLSMHHLPKSIIQAFLEEKTLMKSKMIQEGWGTSFDIPYNDLIWKGYGKFSRKVAFFIVKVIVKINRLFY